MYPCATTTPMQQCFEFSFSPTAYYHNSCSVSLQYHEINTCNSCNAQNMRNKQTRKSKTKIDENKYGNICYKYLKALMPFANMMEHSQAPTISF